MAVAVQRYRFTVDQYHRMAEAGIFHPDCRVELVDGEIFEMSPIGPWHSGVVNRLTYRFVTGWVTARSCTCRIPPASTLTPNRSPTSCS